jgi:hypothetical protein
MAVLNLDIAQRLDIVCRKGDTFEFSFDIGDTTIAQLGDWQMEVRISEDADTTSPSDEIIVSTSDAVSESVITLSIDASTMAGVPAGLYVYDIQNEATGVVKTYLYGTFKVNDDITV